MKWLLVFLISPCMVFAESMRGVVINVIDGDTVILLEKTPERMRTHRIQLEGIDAPERGQNGYESAKEYLEKLVWGETVTVRYTGNDRYGRILGEVWHGNLFVNEEMVKEGWAWIYEKSSASRKLISLERDARKAQKGIWSEPNPISPREWRAAERRKKSDRKNTGEIFY